MEPVNGKERLIEVTIELIEEENGNMKNVTSRKIAERAGVGLGLINYHFKSKENLIATCVQRIINNVIKGFHESADYDSDEEQLTAWATYVFNFLYENPTISRISILNDLENYSDQSNSVRTQQGFQYALKREVQEEDKSFIAFVLTSALQVAFLSGAYAKAILGYDFTRKSDREAYIKHLVHNLIGNKYNNNKVLDKEEKTNE